MWVVKIGGSLAKDPLLPQWLSLLAQLGGGRVALVCGGGRFADEVRQAQQHWHFDNLAAHNMAVLAMAQNAYLAHGLCPDLQLATSDSELRGVLQRGHAAVWLPLASTRSQPDEDTHWDVSSDSMALALARSLNAERLVVVKSCAVDRQASLALLTERGVLDRQFAPRAAGVAFPISIVQKTELAWMRSLLIGDMRLADSSV
jgi:5-(aminomethyl)-3-furanmethanol phosphate kinase